MPRAAPASWKRPGPWQNDSAALDDTGPCRAHNVLDERCSCPRPHVRRRRRARRRRRRKCAGQEGGEATAKTSPPRRLRAAKKAAAEEGRPAPRRRAAKKPPQAPPSGRSGAVTLDERSRSSVPTARRSCPTSPTSSSRRTSRPTRRIKEDEKEATFVVSDADDADEPEQQVMVAGATADPVKDYLKQIGKVPLLNAEMEVELAKRIEAGLFSRGEARQGRQDLGQARGGARVDRRGRPPREEPPARGEPPPGRVASPSATPAAACSSST